MSLDKPYSAYRTDEPLHAFVKEGLRSLGIAVSEEGDTLLIDVNDDERKLLSLPGPGKYVLRFTPKDYPTSERSLGTPVLVTVRHPLVKRMSGSLNCTYVQSADYVHENKPASENLRSWVLMALNKIGLSNSEFNIREAKEILGVEVWFEAESDAGRGMFPVVLSFASQDANRIWKWTPEFQAFHGKRRGELSKIGDNGIKIPSSEVLEKAVRMAQSVIENRFKKSSFRDGAFLRRLRQLREAEVQLAIAEKKQESDDVIQRYMRRIRDYRKEIRQEISFLPNSLVLLCGTTNLLLESFWHDSETQSDFDVSLFWSLDTPNKLRVSFHNMNLTQEISLDHGMPLNPLGPLQRCPMCRRIRLSEEISGFDFGSGTACKDCRTQHSCSVCGRSVGLDEIRYDSFRTEQSILCPDHAITCSESGQIVHPDDMIVTRDGRKCHKSLVDRCYLCEGDNRFWPISDLLQHSNSDEILLCPEHARRCSQTRRILLPSEVVVLPSNDIVGLDLTEVCVECHDQKRSHQHHLKENLQAYSKNKSQYLCSEHAIRCSITGKTLRKRDIVILESGQTVDRNLTVACSECVEEKNSHYLHLREDVKKYKLDETQYLCAKHAIICDVSKAVLKKRDTVVINTGKRVDKSLTGVCQECLQSGQPHYYLKDTLSKIRLKRKVIYACEEHSFHCWSCNQNVPELFSYSKRAHLRNLCTTCAADWHKHMKGGCQLCLGFGWTGTGERGFDKCPRCGQRTLPRSKAKPRDSGFNKHGLIQVDKPRVYHGVRNGMRYKLVVQSRRFRNDYWWLMDMEGRGLATNMDELLVCRIDDN
ncbi:MAG: hypothetical protein DRN81_02215 [Thermoproteota archaeon]|nr:MAG: hypothetical protein DRN81_02215 [Candidatus Korarchaeota archaeon]